MYILDFNSGIGIFPLWACDSYDEEIGGVNDLLGTIFLGVNWELGYQFWSREYYTAL